MKLAAVLLFWLASTSYAETIGRETADEKECSPSHVQVTFTSSTVFSGISCTNISNSNIQQPFAGTQRQIEVAFDNTEFVIDASSASSRVTCYGCTMGAELVGTVAMIVSSVSCPVSASQWAVSVRKFFDIVINMTPHVMSVDVGNRIEVRSMVPLLDVRLSDGQIVTSPPPVGRQPVATTTTSAPATTQATTNPPPTTAATTAPPTTAATTTTAPPTTAATTAPPTTAAPTTAATECPAGSYIKKTKCRLCPVGEYNERPNQSKCRQCPNGKTTKAKGSTSVNQCEGPCPKGHYSSDGNVPCDPCPIGYYQQFTGQTSCRKCLPGYTTTATGMSSTLSCKRVTTQPPPTTAARTTAPPTTRTTAPPTTKATTPPTTARTTAPPTTKTTTRPTTARTTAPPTAPPTPKVTSVTLSAQVGYVNSSNYPQNYSTMETTSSMISCKGNAKSLVIMILDITLANGDSLLLNGAQTTGPINYPVPKFYTPGSLNVTFVSDASQVAKGFNLAYACHDNSVKGIVRLATEDCSVRRFLKGNNVAISKLLQLAKDPAVGFIKYAADPDVAPIIAVINSGRSNPCS